MRGGGLVVVYVDPPVPAGFESRPRASPQRGLRGGRSLCEYCTNKLTKLGPDWPKVKKNYFYYLNM